MSFCHDNFDNITYFPLAGPLASIQVPDTANFNMNELVAQFKSIAARAGFDNTYIDTAVRDICSAENKGSGERLDISEYIKTLSSDYGIEQNKEQFSSHDQWAVGVF